MNEDETHVIIRWQTCDDDCPSAEYYRLVARQSHAMSGTGISDPLLVRQERKDGKWVDDETVGHIGIDGRYEVVDQLIDKWGDGSRTNSEAGDE